MMISITRIQWSLSKCICNCKKRRKRRLPALAGSLNMILIGTVEETDLVGLLEIAKTIQMI